MFVHSPAISFSPQVVERAKRVRLVFRVLLDRVGPAVQVTELSVDLAARTVALLVENPQPLVGVQFRHSRVSSLASYENHFGAPVTFDHDASAIELDARDLALPIHDASVQLRELAEDYLQQLVQPNPTRSAQGHAPLRLIV